MKPTFWWKDYFCLQNASQCINIPVICIKHRECEHFKSLQFKLFKSSRLCRLLNPTFHIFIKISLQNAIFYLFNCESLDLFYATFFTLMITWGSNNYFVKSSLLLVWLLSEFGINVQKQYNFTIFSNKNEKVEILEIWLILRITSLLLL